MAMGWLTVLKMLPWSDVIENAPKVAQGAKKLWNTVGKKPAAPAPAVNGQGSPDDTGLTLAAVQAQLAALQVATAELHQQMLESSALIGSLAEQNTQLIARLEVNRQRVLWLAGVLLVLVVVLAIKLF
ncbi:hypothetical protein GALL_482150 [mine drainage metagenome]|uniref:Methyl-accepting chemotaxis protein n=1 Tax=mine drainage metagenome TaxID=410659 RepID=A0A1J5PEX3_9ZZZZ